MEKNSLILRSPKYYPGEPDWKGKVYMPVSMNNMLVRDEDTVTEILRWIFEKTNTCHAILGDYLHRNNIMLDGTGVEGAVLISEKQGKELELILKKSAEKFSGKTLVISSSSLFYKREDFTSRLIYYNKLYINNTKFSNEINYLIHQFIERQGHMEGNPEQLLLCRNYLLEELVIFEILSEENFCINIYPGKQLRVFKRIVDGSLPDVSKALEKVTLIEMRFRPSSASGWVKNKINDQKLP